jgi:GDP-mannose 6-dehydrogenase
MLAASAAEAVAGADAVIVTHTHPEYRALAAETDKPIIDVARLWKDRSDAPAHVHGIGW